MTTDRVVCAQCGANNFATQAACWKCGNALTAAPAGIPQSAVAVARPAVASPESPAALWASLALGVLLPVVSIPVGLVFLMLDDRRKAQIGWWNIIAGAIGTILSLLVTAAMILPMLTSLTKGLPLGGLRGSVASPDLNSDVSPHLLR